MNTHVLPRYIALHTPMPVVRGYGVKPLYLNLLIAYIPYSKRGSRVVVILNVWQRKTMRKAEIKNQSFWVTKY